MIKACRDYWLHNGENPESQGRIQPYDSSDSGKRVSIGGKCRRRPTGAIDIGGGGKASCIHEGWGGFLKKGGKPPLTILGKCKKTLQHSGIR